MYVADTDRAKELVREGAPAGVRDAVHAAVMLNNDIRVVASFEAGFDRIAGVERLPLG
jgi:predicted nucleic acid-binding protein